MEKGLLFHEARFSSREESLVLRDGDSEACASGGGGNLLLRDTVL